MDKISDVLDKRLKEMPLLDYLQSMHDKIENVRHYPKSNSAYDECREFSRHVKYRIVSEYKISWEDFNSKYGKNLKISEDILDLYSFSESDKRKEARIKEFIGEYTYDLKNKINAILRHKQDANTPIEDDEI